MVSFLLVVTDAVTYVKEAWATAAGYLRHDVSKKTALSYDEYYDNA